MTFELLKVFTDGASSGNPGIAGIGCAVYDAENNEIAVKNQNIGIATNNIAEYRALILGLDTCLELSPKKIEFYLDSELVVKQILGEYKVANQDLRQYYDLFFLKIKNIPFSIKHIRRIQNKTADKLAVLAKSNQIINRKK